MDTWIPVDASGLEGQVQSGPAIPQFSVVSTPAFGPLMVRTYGSLAQAQAVGASFTGWISNG